MQKLYYNGTELPLQLGFRAMDCIAKDHIPDQYEEPTTLAQIAQIALIGLNEGARLCGDDSRYTEDDIWDMMDFQPDTIVQIKEAFGQTAEKLGRYLKKI